MIKCVKLNKYMKFDFKGIIERIGKLESDSFASIDHASSTKIVGNLIKYLLKKGTFQFFTHKK